jgi:hypothetical protein
MLQKRARSSVVDVRGDMILLTTTWKVIFEATRKRDEKDPTVHGVDGVEGVDGVQGGGETDTPSDSQSAAKGEPQVKSDAPFGPSSEPPQRNR